MKRGHGKTKSLVAIWTLTLAATMPLMAETWTDPDTGYTWYYRINGDTAEIFNNWSTAISPSPTNAVVVPSTLGGYPVTSIGDYAFFSCSNLTNVTFPSSVTSIGSSAFFYCSNLANVTLSSSLTSIGSGAFSYSGLTRVTISSGVTNIGEKVFCGCSELTAIMVEADNTHYLSVDDLLLSKDGMTLIQGVNGDVTIPSSVIHIGDYAFCDFHGLTNVTIPSSVTNIGDWAFSECVELTHVTIPSSVMSIGAGAFSGCTNISVDIDNPMYFLSDGLLLTKDGTMLIQGVNTAVTIPSNVTSICAGAFYGCNGLTSVRIPSNVTHIGDYAFAVCGGLTRMTIPDNVTNIGDYAFAICSSLTNVVVGSGVTGIGSGAFNSCRSLENVSFRGNAPNLININSFAGVKDYCTVYVRKDSTGWGVVIPGMWNGLRIEYLADAPECVIPSVAADATPEAVTNAIETAGFADADGVKAAIAGSVAKYAAFKTWARSVKHPGGTSSSETEAGEAAVVANTNTAAAFLLGAERLFENRPTIKIVEVAVGEKWSQGLGTMTMSVVVKDGDETVQCAAEKVKDMFEAVSDLSVWSEGRRVEDNVSCQMPLTVTIDESSSPSAMRFKVTPGDGTADKAFLRMKVK